MAAVRSDRFRAPSGRHDRRVLAWTRATAIDALADRTVWSAAALPGGRAAAERLRALLLRGDLSARLLALDLPGSATATAGPPDATLDAEAAPGDVVVLHDEPAPARAAALRERGLHAIWHIRPPLERPTRRSDVARAFPRPQADPVDAVVVSWREPSGRRPPVEGVAALVPKARLVIVKEAATADSAGVSADNVALAWISILGDVVEDDRDDHVGGTLNARPFVARR
jgi:hypothetical protein